MNQLVRAGISAALNQTRKAVMRRKMAVVPRALRAKARAVPDRGQGSADESVVVTGDEVENDEGDGGVDDDLEDDDGEEEEGFAIGAEVLKEEGEAAGLEDGGAGVGGDFRKDDSAAFGLEEEQGGGGGQSGNEAGPEDG